MPPASSDAGGGGGGEGGGHKNEIDSNYNTLKNTVALSTKLKKFRFSY